MPITNFKDLWNNHVGSNRYPCDKKYFTNQCAIRMGVAMEDSGFDTSSFDEMFSDRRCYAGLNHRQRHILAAHQLAQWMRTKPGMFGGITVYQSENLDERYAIKGKKGIVYIHHGWDATSHIDLWDGKALKAGTTDYLDLGTQLWFWEAIK